jgi:formiminotetrahydrofolate cyclodeaminase
MPRASMNDARREEIRRVLTLIEEAKGMLEGVLDQQQADFDNMPKAVDFDNMPKDVQNDEEGQRAEEVVDALEQAATCCEDAISACREVLKD